MTPAKQAVQAAIDLVNQGFLDFPSSTEAGARELKETIQFARKPHE